MKILALDIGGTEVKYGYFGETEEYGKFSVKDSDGIERLPENIIRFIKKFDVTHIGICAPGPFDYTNGTGYMKHKLESLNGISLKEEIKKVCPLVETVFIHDGVAFAMGEVYNNPVLEKENFSVVMLGTGLGYVHITEGKAEINDSETTLKPLWNNPYKDGVAEEYVSATAIIRRAKELGYNFSNVLDIANAVMSGDKILEKLFYDVGEDMGYLLNEKQKEDKFERLVIGGQVSLSWKLFKEGFEKVCKIPYYVVEKPATCAVLGIKYCVEKGKENLYQR